MSLRVWRQFIYFTSDRVRAFQISNCKNKTCLTLTIPDWAAFHRIPAIANEREHTKKLLNITLTGYSADCRISTVKSLLQMPGVLSGQVVLRVLSEDKNDENRLKLYLCLWSPMILKSVYGLCQFVLLVSSSMCYLFDFSWSMSVFLGFFALFE